MTSPSLPQGWTIQQQPFNLEESAGPGGPAGPATAVVALTDAAMISVNASQGSVFTVTLGGNRTLTNPSNPTSGQRIIFEVTQDSTGSRTLSYGSAYAFSTSLPQPILSTGAGATDYLDFVYSAASGMWRLIGFVSGF